MVDVGSGLLEEGLGLTVLGLFVSGLIFGGDAAVVVAAVDVNLLIVLDGLTTGLTVENIAVEFTGRSDVTVVYVLVAVTVGLFEIV